MPTVGHAQRRDDDAPPPCDCGGCREFRAITAEPRREYYPPVRADDVEQRPVRSRLRAAS